MSWIQENKFVAGVAGVTAVIGGAILFYGFSQGSEYNQKLEKYEELKAQYSQLEKSQPYPSAKNLKHREQKIADYEDEIKEVEKLISAYKPTKLEKVTPEKFKDLQVQMESELRSKFEKARVELPENCLFGFEKYATTSVRADATPKLVYELGAVKWLMSELASLKPEKVVNIRRSELPEESGKKEVVTSKSKLRKHSFRGKGKSLSDDNKVYELMPFELTFTAKEDVVRKFLMKIVNSDEYFYAIRAIRIRNEKQIPPNVKDANFPVEVKSNTLEDEFSFDGELLGDDAAADNSSEEKTADSSEGKTADKEEVAETDSAASEPAIPAGEAVLKKVLGGENLNVCIVFDIVLIKEQQKDKKKLTHKRR